MSVEIDIKYVSRFAPMLLGSSTEILIRHWCYKNVGYDWGYVFNQDRVTLRPPEIIKNYAVLPIDINAIVFIFKKDAVLFQLTWC